MGVASKDWGEVLAALRGGPGRAAKPELLDQALALGHDVAPGTVGCSLTELHGPQFRTPAASTDVALTLDHAQYADGAGPCVNATRNRQLQRIDALEHETRFPGFVTTALGHGVRSSLSLPVADLSRPTALNIYSTVAAAFSSDEAHRVALLLSRVIAAAARSHEDPAASETTKLGQARERGRRVNAAIEDVMRRNRMGRSAALAVLVDLSRRRQAGLDSVAAEVLRGEGGHR